MPELTPVDPFPAPDVTIRIDDHGAMPADVQWVNGQWTFYPQMACIAWDVVGTVVVRDGREIMLSPVPNVENALLTNLTVTVAFNMLLYQRGLFLLHASAVAVNGFAVGFVGASGWGKSTLAAFMQTRGYPLITDDALTMVVADDAMPLVLPAVPQIKLWPDALVSLGAVPDQLPRVYSQIEKRTQRLRGGFADGMLPLHTLYVLGFGDQPMIEPLSLQDAVKEVLVHWYFNAPPYANLGHSKPALAQHLRAGAQVAGNVTIRRLRRRWGLA
ncbi:MAG: serine kinase [Chloroflexi bacterium]|nr:serine kinase [Chloroflexota bacterium]